MPTATKKKPKAKPPETRYELREGFRIPVPGQVIGERIEALKAANGGQLTARQAWEAERSPDAPLHRCYEWDNDKAADLYRDDQARHVIRSYYVVRSGDDAPEVREIANVCVVRPGDEDRERVYVSSARAMGDADMREQVIDEVMGMLRGIHKRYRHLPGIKKLFREAVERLELPE